MEINGYRLGRKIAETELCSVHNAIDLASSKTVSVRIFHQRMSHHPGFCTGFSRFAESVLGERAGVMVTLLQYGAEADACYAVTDYFPCLPLLQTQPVQMPAKAVLQGGMEIAATLDLLHARDLVHGALRPGNLFFNDQLKLTLGLGINRPEGSSARPLPVDSATAALYLPPEGGDGPDADWYALGVCLYQQLIGRAPFDDSDLQQQLGQKREGLSLLPENGHQALLPLLQALLHPMPERRIRSADAFWEQADAAGYRLLRPHFAAEPTTEAPVQPAPPPKSPATAEPAAPSSRVEATGDSGDAEAAGSSRKLVIAAVVVVVAAFAAFLLWPGEEPAQAPASTEQTTASSTAPAASPVTAPEPRKSEPEAIVTVSPPPPEQLPEDEQRYLKARSLFAEGRPGQALMAVNEALRINPNNRDAGQLRQSILDELEIRSILKRAEEQLQAGRLTSPPGDNALESYRSLAALLPKGDPRMQRGLSRIANRFVGLSRKAVAQNRLDDAFRLADTGAGLFPSFSPLQALREDIARQLEEQRLAEQKRQQELRQKEQIRQIELARQKKREQLAARRQQQLDRFERALASNAPLASGVDEASAAYAKLQQLKTPDRQLRPLRERLVKARIALSEQQLERGDFEGANRSLQQGLSLGDDSGALQRQIARLQQAIEQRQQRQQADTLLSEAQLLTESATASPDDLERAALLIDQAAGISPDHPRITSMNRQLLRALDRQAEAAIEAGKLDLAERYIGAGLARNARDTGLLARRQQLEQQRKQKQRRSVPVIGTF